MTASALAHEFSPDPALAEGPRPICGVLKAFPSTLADNTQHADVKLCNFHAWVVARWASAQSLAGFYLKMLNRPSLAKVGSSECDFCRRSLQLGRVLDCANRAALLEQALPGNHAAGGILGRAAEFLVSQQGL